MALGKNKAKYILNEKPRLEKDKQKNITDDLAKIIQNDYNNLPSIPLSDYDI
jgi:hypothetical protein